MRSAMGSGDMTPQGSGSPSINNVSAHSHSIDWKAASDCQDWEWETTY